MKKNEIEMTLPGVKESKVLGAFGLILIFCFSLQVCYSIEVEKTNDTQKSFNQELQQKKMLTGTVTDLQGKPVAGVTVYVKGTSVGTITDSNGKYSLIDPPENATLVFSFVGMKTKEVVFNNQPVIDVVLTEDTIGIEEVVAVGYGTMKKADLTGSVASIGAEELTSVPSYNTERILKGRASGVEVKQNSGNPLARIEVRIRGANSMIGSNDPLYVVNGVPLIGGIEYLSPSDIETIDILKDASATAIYGARGANGVVMVTTRQGIKGQKGKISIDSYYGFQNDLKRYDVLDAKQYATVVNEWLKNEGSEPFFNVTEVKNPGTDWQEVIFRTAPIQSHSVSFSGSSEKTTYSLTGNYYVQDGIIRNTSVKKGSVKLSLQHEVNSRINISGNIILTRRETFNTSVDNGAYGKTTLSGALSAPPTLPVYDEDGLPTKIETEYYFGSVDMRNPALYLSPRKDRNLMDKILANTAIEIKILEGLTFRTLAGIEYFHGIYDDFVPVIYPSDKGYAADGYGYQNSVVSENTLNYIKKIKEHSFNVVGGFTYQSYLNRGESASVTGLATNTTENYNLAGATTINTPSNYISEWTLLSWLGRINYSYKGKYLFTASIRSDGSSRFGANHKWGIFPSAAIGWRISDEEFMKSVPQIKHLKLRASYGVTGNTALSPYQSLSRLSSVKYISSGDSQEVGWTPNGISNADLRWETTKQADFGFDMSIFNEKLFLTFDYYNKVTSNLLATVPLPPSLGYTSTLDNLGKIRNRGVELSLDAHIFDREFKWNMIWNISANRNKVLELSKGSDIESGTLDIPFYSATNIIREGEPFGMFYGYQEDGLDDEGFIKYIDNLEDGAINASDRVIIGNPYPDFIYSVSNNLYYKNFDLNFFIDASQGNDIFWATAGTHLNSFQRGHNQFVDLIGNYWTAENPDPHAKYPKVSSETSFTVSDRFIKDGSYIRLKTITLGYSLPLQKLGINWCSKARFYISGINLLTITNYPGLDPESNTVGTDDQDASSRARIGIDQGAYPSARSIHFGFSLSF